MVQLRLNHLYYERCQMENLNGLYTRCVAHEIRNHVSICDMYSEIIKKHLQKSNITNESIDNALDCIKKSLKIITTSLLDLKSMDNFELKICEVRYLVEEAVRLSDAYSVGKKIEINLLTKNSALIKIDENKFLACLVNIIKNGIEAIEASGEIFILSEVIDDFVHIKISNNGKMIPVEKQKEIFNQGFSTKSNGCGLGLYICKNNLEKFNAQLLLNKSTKSKTEFEIIVPVEKN